MYGRDSLTAGQGGGFFILRRGDWRCYEAPLRGVTARLPEM